MSAGNMFCSGISFSTHTTEIIKIKIKKARSLQASEVTSCLAPKRSPSEWDPLALFPYNSFCANDTAWINSAIIKAIGNGWTGQSFSQPGANTQWPEQTSCYLLPLLSRSCCCKWCCEWNHRRNTRFVLLLELVFFSWWKILYREVSKTSPHLRCGVSVHTASSERFRQKKKRHFLMPSSKIGTLMLCRECKVLAKQQLRSEGRIVKARRQKSDAVFYYSNKR